MKDNSADVEIREIVIDDLPYVFHLGEELFTPQDFPNLYRTWDEYAVAGLFISEPEFCLAACIGSKLAGFALGTVIEKPRTAWNYGHLVWLGVDKSYQREGIANKLVSEFIERMGRKGVRIILVDTQADNTGAIKFFKNQGFGNLREHIYMTLNLDEVNNS